MAKRAHFIDSDLETFFQKEDWDKELKSKVDYSNVKLYKSRSTKIPTTFLACLVYHAMLKYDQQLPAKMAQAFSKLDAKGYAYSLEDLNLPGGYHGEISQEMAEGLVLFLNTMQDKGIDLTASKDFIEQKLSYATHPKLDNFLLEKNLIDPVKKVKQHLNLISNHGACQLMNIFMFVDKAEKKHEEQKCQQSKDYIKQLFNSGSLSKTQMLEVLAEIFPDQMHNEHFINKHQLPIGIFNQVDYFRALPLKPRELFSNDIVEIIELIEKSIGVKYLDDSGRSPQEVFKEVCQKEGKDFNTNLTITYRDGSETTLMTKRSFR